MFDGRIQMLQLLIPDPLQRLHQFPDLLTHLLPSILHLLHPPQQHPHLPVIVAPNLRLHRLRTRHRRLPAHDRRAPAQRRRGHLPHRVQGRGSDAVFREEVVEGGEVAGFLVVHVLHQGSKVGVRFGEGWGLRGVD